MQKVIITKILTLIYILIQLVKKGVCVRALFLLIFITIYSFALSVPNRVYTTVSAVNGSSLTLNKSLPVNGMSALVVRSGVNGDYALVFIKQTSNNKVVIIDDNPVGGRNLAKLKPIVKVGDRVIGGFNYDKALVIAPKNSYNEVVSQLGLKTIDPNLYNSYRASGGSSSYKNFAKLTGIGLVIVAKGNTLEIIDAISEEIIGKESLK